jgi:hypothetical protein
MATSASSSGEVVLRLTKEEALVFYEFVARFSDNAKLSIEDQAEERVLWDICCMFESQLVAPLSTQYASALASARQKVRDKEG